MTRVQVKTVKQVSLKNIENQMLAHIQKMDTFDWAKLYLTTVTCCFIIFSVTFLNSYNIFSSLIVCSYVFFLSPKVRKKIQLGNIEKALIAIMICYIASFLMEVVLYDSKIRILDKPAKVLLLIPLVPLLNAIKVDYRYLIAAFIISSGLLLGLAGYDKYILEQIRPGSLINAIQFSAISIAIASAALAFTAVYSQHTLKEKLYLVLLICVASGGILAGILGQSRGSIIAIPIIQILIGFLFFSKINWSKTKTALATAVILILTATLIYNSTVMKRFQRSLESTIAFSEGVKAYTPTALRFNLWKVAVEAGMTSPITGIGLQEVVKYKIQQVKLRHYHKKILRYDNSHSTYADTFARRGLIGLTAVILFLGFPIYVGIKIWRRQPQHIAPYAAGLTAFGCVFFISNISQEVIFLNTGIIMYTGLLVILTSLLSERIRASETPLNTK